MMSKVNEDQLRRLIRKLPEFRREYEGFQESVRSASLEKLQEVLGDGDWRRTRFVLNEKASTKKQGLALR